MPTIVGPGTPLLVLALPPEACAVYQMHSDILKFECVRPIKVARRLLLITLKSDALLPGTVYANDLHT